MSFSNFQQHKLVLPPPLETSRQRPEQEHQESQQLQQGHQSFLVPKRLFEMAPRGKQPCTESRFQSPFPSGTRIQKFFDSIVLENGAVTKPGWYQGKIHVCLGRLSEKGRYLYRIIYDHGGQEEWEHDQVLESIIQQHPAPFQGQAFVPSPTGTRVRPHCDSVVLGDRQVLEASSNDSEIAACQSSTFVERVESILGRYTQREEECGPGQTFTSVELAELALLCSAQQPSNAAGNDSFAAVPSDSLTSLVTVLLKQVQEAEKLNIFAEAVSAYRRDQNAVVTLQRWLKNDVKSRLQVLRFGLEAANIILLIAGTDGIDRRAVNEDALQSVVTLFRFYMKEHAIPALNETAHTMFHSQNNNTPNPESSSRKRRRESSTPDEERVSPTLRKEIKIIYKIVSSTFLLYYVLMERIELVIKKMLLDDHKVLLTTNAALQAFEIDCQSIKEVLNPPGHQLQVASIAIVSTAFGKYPNQRETILEELFPVLPRLPMTKRSLRAFRVRYSSASSTSLAILNSTIMKPLWDQNSQNHCIQMVTALLLASIQSCVVRPTFSDEEREGLEQENLFLSGLTACQRISTWLVFELLKRCKRSKYGGATQEYRIFLGHLVQDLLSVLIVPEYPASEMFLLALMGALYQDIEQARLAGPSKVKEGTGTENTYVSFVLELLGKICAMEASLLKCSRELPLEMRTSAEDTVGDDEDNVRVSCYCGSAERGCLLLSCDDCKIFFHGKCVGQNCSEAVPDEWLCDSCRLGRIFKRENRIKLGGTEDDIIDTSYVINHGFLSSLVHRKGVENITSAIQFHFAKWIDDLHLKVAKSQNQAERSHRVWKELVNQWEDMELNGEPLTEEGYNRMLIARFAQSSQMALTFKGQIAFIIKMMEDTRSPHLRKLALRAIEKTTEGDDKLMLFPVIAKPVSRRLTDESISVREAALSFVGNHVVRFPTVAAAFHSSLIVCLGDTGVSVRKRAIRIFQDVLLTNPHYEGRSEACDVMLQRAAYRKEEDTVRDLIYDLFTKLWLQDGEQIVAGSQPSPRKMAPEPSQSEEAPLNAKSKSEGKFLASPTNIESRRNLKRVELAAEQMMEVVRISGTGDHLEKLLKKLYDAKQDEEHGRKLKNRAEISGKHLVSLVKALFDLLLSVEECRSQRGPRIGEDLAATLRAVEVIAGTAPSAVLPHLDTILPYLKADNGVGVEDESMIVSACCDIITRASSVFDRDDLNRFASLSVANDLRQIVYKFGPNALNSAIRTLSTLAHHPKSNHDSLLAKYLLNMAKTFYGYLLRHQNVPDFSSSKVDEKVRFNLQRAAAVLGLICQHRGRTMGEPDDESFELPDGDLLVAEDLSWSNLTLSCYQIMSKYIEKKDTRTKCVALRSLGSIFLSEPRLLFVLEQNGLVNDIMSPQAPLALQLEALDCWKRILESEEKRIDAGHAKEKMERNKSITVVKQVSGDQDGDSNLFGGVLTSHADRLFQMVSHKDAQLRLSSLELLGLLLRQGLVNPNDAVPYLLALQGDVENHAIRGLALEMLITEGEKRPDMIQQRVRAGVKLAFIFQKSVYPDRPSVSALLSTGSEVECVFGRVFKECVAKIRKQRQGLFASLLGLFDLKEIGNSLYAGLSPRKTPTQGRDGVCDLSLLTFAAEILAHLPYSSAEDPLFIIHKISSIAALYGDQILDKFGELLKPVWLDNADKWDNANEEEDALEKAAKGKFPSRDKAAYPLTTDHYDLKSFANHCQTAGGFVLLMRVKLYLRHIYKLSEIRCLEYSPKEKERISDRGIFKIEKAPTFDSKLPSIFLGASTQINTDGLICIYAEFRQLFREELAANAKVEEDKEETMEQDNSAGAVGSVDGEAH